MCKGLALNINGQVVEYMRGRKLEVINVGTVENPIYTEGYVPTEWSNNYLLDLPWGENIYKSIVDLKGKCVEHFKLPITHYSTNDGTLVDIYKVYRHLLPNDSVVECMFIKRKYKLTNKDKFELVTIKARLPIEHASMKATSVRTGKESSITAIEVPLLIVNGKALNF